MSSVPISNTKSKPKPYPFPSLRRRYYCPCREKYVANSGECYPCPNATPTPSPSVSYNPSPTPSISAGHILSFPERCQCSTGKIFGVTTKEECLKLKGCYVPRRRGSGDLGGGGALTRHWCRCTGSEVYSQEDCCKCMRTKCKCWHPWWKWERHRKNQCNTICRKNRRCT